MRVRMRRLRHHGHTFVWRAVIGHVQGAQQCHRTIRVRVWRDGRNSRPLEADLLSLAWGGPWEPCDTDGSYPAGGDVRALIDAGLRAGWEPAVRGGVFHLTAAVNSGLGIVGFVVTDFARTRAGVDPTAQVVAAVEGEKTPRGAAGGV
jgi:hypothetical protein